MTGLSVARAAELFLRHAAVEKGLSRNTLAAYRRDLDRYAAHLAGLGVAEIEAVGPELVQGYAEELAAPSDEGAVAASPASRARMLSTVRGLHRFLVEEGRLDRDPTERLTPPRLPKALPKALTVDEMARLLAAAEGDEPERLRDRALFELLYATGARISEAVALVVDDLAEGAALVRLHGKGGKQRVVPVGEYAQEALAAYLVRARPVFSLRGKASPALFLGVRGGALSRQNAWLVIQQAAERAGLAAHVSPHTFRHSFATHLLAGGADVRVVQELLGHASVATTQIYTKVTIDTLKDVYLGAHPRAR